MDAGKLPDPSWVEAESYGEDQHQFRSGFSGRYFLLPPPPDSPSAFFAVGVPADPLEEPNMMFEAITVTSTTGVTLGFKEETTRNCAQMVATAEADDNVVRFKIPVLVNNKILKRGDLLTRPPRSTVGCATKAEREVVPILLSNVTKRHKK